MIERTQHSDLLLMLTALKWEDDGELSFVDMERVLCAMQEQAASCESLSSLNN